MQDNNQKFLIILGCHLILMAIIAWSDKFSIIGIVMAGSVALGLAALNGILSISQFFFGDKTMGKIFLLVAALCLLIGGTLCTIFTPKITLHYIVKK